eukprot:5924816-Prymnesium_polylepis.1
MKVKPDCSIVSTPARQVSCPHVAKVPQRLQPSNISQSATSDLSPCQFCSTMDCRLKRFVL